MIKIIQKIKKEDKIFSLNFLGIMVVLIVLNTINFKSLNFLLLSFLVNLFLIFMYIKCIKLFDIKFNKKQKLFILLIIISIYIFYFYSVLTRNFIYYWDYSCYYNLQIITKFNFNVSLFDGLKGFIGSTWSGEYGTFLSFFPEIVFNFTNKSINSYLLSCVIVFIPYIIISLSMLIKIIFTKVKIKKENIFFYLSLFIFSVMPILHATFIYGQPDLFGLAFIFLLVLLTLNYDFKKVEYERLILIFLVTFMLLITRRWYMYFILSYYICYVLNIIIKNYKNKKEFIKIIKNILLFGFISICVICITLFPLIKNIIASDFSNSYAFYLNGGFKVELINQFRHMGIILFIIMMIGFMHGLIKKDYRLTTSLSIVCYLLMIFLFTRIQNMGLHHSLILLPIYLYYIYLFLLLLSEIFEKKLYIMCFLVSFVLSINFLYGVSDKLNNRLFTDISLKTPIEKDYSEIENVSKWLKNHLNEENKAYMITHNNMYNPDKFRNFYMPNLTIYNYLPYGSAVLGVHKFPIELFEAKYIITTSPFESISVEEKYNKVFNMLILNGTFNLKQKFNMQNGYKILIYERIKSVDINEINAYKEELEEESIAYPKLYNEIIDDYLKKNVLNRG